MNQRLSQLGILNVDWSAEKVATIRDFRHAAYAIEGADYCRAS